MAWNGRGSGPGGTLAWWQTVPYDPRIAQSGCDLGRESRMGDAGNTGEEVTGMDLQTKLRGQVLGCQFGIWGTEIELRPWKRRRSSRSG